MRRVNKNLFFAVWIVLVNLLVGLVFSFYHLLIPVKYKQNYYSPLVLNTGADSLAVDETIAYGTMTREIMDGDWILSDSYLWEYKNKPSPLIGELMPALIMGGLSKIGGNVDKGFMLADFILPMIIFSELGYFIYLLSKRPWLSTLGSLMVMIFFKYFKYFPYLPSIIKIIFQAPINGSVSEFTRSFHPQVSFIFMLILAIVVFKINKRQKDDKRLTILLGIILGSLFYSYLFFWTFALVWLGVSFIWAIIERKKGMIKTILKGSLLGLGLGIPYFITMIKFFLSSFKESFVSNFQYSPDLNIYSISLIIIFWGLASFLVKNSRERIFWQIFYTTSLLLIVIAKISGFAINNPLGHWMLRIVYPFSMSFLVIMIIQKLKQDLKLLAIILTVLLLAYQARAHWQYFSPRHEAYAIESSKVEMFEFLNENLPKNSVVVTTSLVDNLYLATYTSANIFIPRSQQSLAPEQERIERFLVAYKILEVDKDKIANMFRFTDENKQLAKQHLYNLDECGGIYFYFWKYSINHDYKYYDCSIPEEQIAILLDEYEKINDNLNYWAGKYKMDYWLWGPFEEKWAQVDLDKLSGWQLVWQNKDYKLFKI